MAASTWPHWELQLLHAAGLPTTPSATAMESDNMRFLLSWQQVERTTCSRNPLNTSWRVTDSTRCTRLPNGKWARSYISRDSAASAFAQQLNLTDFPHLREALLTGNPDSYDNLNGLLLDLQKWGATAWQQQYADLNGVTIPDTGTRGVDKAGADVSGAWTHLHRVLEREGTATILELQRSAASLRRIERRLRRV